MATGDMYQDPNAPKKPQAPGSLDLANLGSQTQGAPGGSLGVDAGGSLSNAAGGTLGANPSGSQTNGPGQVYTDPGGMAGGNMNPAVPAAPAPVRNNFSWGSKGVGAEGADWGSTNNWTDQQWKDYEARNAPATATPPAPTGPVPPGVGPQAPAAPPPGTPNADVYQQALLKQMGQSEAPSVDDPTIKAQLDPYRVEAQRGMENSIRGGAEAAFAGGQDYGNPEKIAAGERAGEAAGVKASDLVGQELQSRRAQIQDALTKYGANLTESQRQALQQQQMEIDKQIAQSGQAIQREGLAQTGALGAQDIALRRTLGVGGLNNDLIRTLTQDKQAGQQLGGTLAMDSAHLNQQAMLALMGQ